MTQQSSFHQVENHHENVNDSLKKVQLSSFKPLYMRAFDDFIHSINFKEFWLYFAYIVPIVYVDSKFFTLFTLKMFAIWFAQDATNNGESCSLESFYHKNHHKIKLETKIFYSYTHTSNALPWIRLNIHFDFFSFFSSFSHATSFEWRFKICIHVQNIYRICLDCLVWRNNRMSDWMNEWTNKWLNGSTNEIENIKSNC